MSATMQLSIMHRVSKRLRALVRDRRANTAVEFALAAPALFLFMFGIIEVGYALWMQNALDYSVAAAARCASLSGSACSGSPSLVTSCGERVRRLSRLDSLHLHAYRRLRLSGERKFHDRPRDPVEPGNGEFVIERVHRSSAPQELRLLNPQSVSNMPQFPPSLKRPLPAIRQ